MKQTNTDINYALNVNQEKLYRLSNPSLLLSKKQRVRHLDPIGIRFDSSGWISWVIMEVGPHLELATFTPSYGFLWPGLLSRGVSVCLCTIWSMKTQFMFVFTNSTIKQEHVEIIIKYTWIIYSILKPLVPKFRNITRLILGLIRSPVESPSCKHVFRPGRDATYVGWSCHQSSCGGVIGHLKFESI